MLERGLYEALITERLAERLKAAHAHPIDSAILSSAEAADRFSYHLASVVERAIAWLPDHERRSKGLELVQRLVDVIAAAPDLAEFGTERPIDPASLLQSIAGIMPDGSEQSIGRPLIPLLDTTLLTNAPGEPRVGSQLRTEIASADRIDVVMAFVRRSGIAPLREPLLRHVDSGRKLRVLTTAYTASTEAEALDWLKAMGADVRVSYDVSTTRLHAKAWMFYRKSGFSTAYVGSSNLTHSAQVSGLEWNVRISGARNRSVIDKIEAVFESYWQQPDFEAYDKARYEEATSRPASDDSIYISPVEIRLEPFQERLLELIALARSQGHHRNLLVSATGTGKTVMAAVDYARLQAQLPSSRLLFVAHREEILAQSRATFAHALRDGSFGELWVGGDRPRRFNHVFASIQSLNANGIDQLDPAHFDVVIIDEFHHAAAASYERLLGKIKPSELLGLTATPERSDGLPVLQWFDGRIAAELRLWDAIDQHRLVPFAYYGIADDLDMREIPWRRSTGYDVAGLTDLITGTDVWARKVLKEFIERVGNVSTTRTLGFCVSVSHAQYMARVFAAHGVKAVAVWADTPDAERKAALRDLAAGRVNVVFSVDLFNEGVDVPTVDTLLMLRPTESGLLFLQQLGRGLRRHPTKSICTVLDFVGQHRKEFRYDRRFRALLGGSRKHLQDQVEQGFPFLPAGCHMELDHVASERVLSSIKNALPNTWREKVEELRQLAVSDPKITLAGFLASTGLDLDDVYRDDYSWGAMRADAGLPHGPEGKHEKALRRACGRLLHIDDLQRLNTWREWLVQPVPPVVSQMSSVESRLLRMLLAQLLDKVADKDCSLQEGAKILWAHPGIRSELLDLFEVLEQRISHLPISLSEMPDVPMMVHSRYTRLEVLAACGVGDNLRPPTWREGVRHVPSAGADVFAFTLDKTEGGFSPTTRYRDYAINRELIHWESQSMTKADSDTGRRYQTHELLGHHILLFCRQSTADRSFYFLGRGTYVSHVGEQPMAITWRLEHPLPGDLFQAFAAAVA